jgi:hypothetical protein
MATRSNIIVVTKDGNAHQFYHHWDGYLSGVGEELRNRIIYSVGMSVVANAPADEVLVSELNSTDGYEDEYTHDINSDNHLHADIEFLYIIKDRDFYYVNEWDLCNKYVSYRDLVDYVCTDKNKLDISHTIKDDDNDE